MISRPAAASAPFRSRAPATACLVPPRLWNAHRLHRSFIARSQHSADPEQVLLVGWLLAALRPKGPYPILVLTGEQGASKSTLTALIRALVDPCTAPHRGLPREERDIFIAATHAHVLALDNLGRLSSAQSDVLCRLCTGGAFATRKLFTDFPDSH